MQITELDAAEVCVQAEVEVLTKFSPRQIRGNWKNALRLRIIMITCKRLVGTEIPLVVRKELAEQIIELNAGRRHILQ